MSSQPMQKRLSRGTYQRPLAVNALGVPPTERVYYTPQFPEGRTEHELTQSSVEAQRNVACFWFLSNFKSYDLSDGKWFSFAGNGAGFGQAPFAPSPLTSEDAIDGEFSNCISIETRRSVAEMFPGNWMWIEDTFTDRRILDDPVSPAELQLYLLAKLDELASQVQRLGASEGGLGHNWASAEMPLTSQDQDAVLDEIEKAKDAITSKDKVGIALFREYLALISAKLGSWIASKLDVFVTSFAKSAGTALGQPISIGLLGMCIHLWHNSQAVDELLKLIIEHMR